MSISQSRPNYISLPPNLFINIPSTPTTTQPPHLHSSDLPVFFPISSCSPHTSSALPPNAQLLPSTHLPPESMQRNADVMAEETFPESTDLPVDGAFESEALNALEKIYLFSQSKALYHRIFIATALPDLLEQITPHEAIEYVLPHLSTLATDEDDTVKDAFSSKLVTVIWWFFTHCRVVPGDDVDTDPGGNLSEPDPAGPPIISVQTFTPILGTLLLSPNAAIGGAARQAVVTLLELIKKVNDIESGNSIPGVELEDEFAVGFFGREERTLFEKEILYQVVIGMGRLDDDESDTHDAQNRSSPWRSVNNLVSINGNTPSNTEPYVQFIVSTENGVNGIQSLQRFTGSEEEDNFSLRSGTKRLEDNYNPYFPPVPPARPTYDRTDSPASLPSSGSSISNSGSTTGTTASSSEDEVYLSPSGSDSSLGILPTRSQSPRPSPTLLSSSRFTRDLSPRRSSPSQTPSNDSSVNARQPQESSPSPTASLQHSTLSPACKSPPAEDDNDGDQAAVGRLSSMSLMAAVAASGCLNDPIKGVFVQEVERVARDPVYWVRREVCFAIGALAKVVPEEVVHLSLIPLLDKLVLDKVHHVRHSSLYALPAILSRLPYKARKKLALDVVIRTSMDESVEVRSGVLEALGEVIYTFHTEDKSHEPFNDGTSESPPEELLGMFLGRTQDRRIIDGQEPDDDKRPPGAVDDRRKALDAFFDDASRPLICAFNFPAVALTFGRCRWPTLRETYLSLAQAQVPDIHRTGIERTLAASLGEMAKIVGPENAQRDLLPLWSNAVKHDADDIRMKALECVSSFVSALGTEGQIQVLNYILQTWESGTFRAWRERETITRSLYDIIDVVGQEAWKSVVELEMISLLDSVNAVREAGIHVLPKLWTTLRAKSPLLENLSESLLTMAQSTSSRKRMTFIACQQALVTADDVQDLVVQVDDAFCESIAPLSGDEVLGVRIGVARLVGNLYTGLSRQPKPVPSSLQRILSHLVKDSSLEVRAYVTNSSDNRDSLTQSSVSSRLPVQTHNASRVSTFSRPPVFHAAPEGISSVLI
ncbi:hypothetical protein D9758_003243 [Tetrapyrgos nigripes]|uniref:ARM repeat-containing protein n=1 Tax=Tetrapyrgos nigripes TaxID=182062 RepID=A0A8H5GIX0_9AGAR|nr:hypothetical protein D9758_003243 [Tetrapyrgos nigripes]